jgi:5'-nucleotidase
MTRRRLIGLAVVAVALVALAVRFWPSSPATRGGETVTILFTNDTHSALEPIERANWPAPAGGVARRKTLVGDIRRERGADNVLLLDAGDFSFGTLFYTTWKGSADVMALNALGYDAVTLGNHDFELGAEALGAALRGGKLVVGGAERDTEALRARVVSSNVDVSLEPALRDRVVTRAIIERGGHRYGIVGLLTSEAITGRSVKVSPDYADAVTREVGELRKSGIDRIILLSHCGVAADRRLAPKLSGVDVIVSAHDHQLVLTQDARRKLRPFVGRNATTGPIVVKDHDGKNTVIVSAGANGVWLGRLDVRFDDNGDIPDGAFSSEPLLLRGCSHADGGPEDCTSAVREDPELAARVRAYGEPFAALGHEVIGTAAEPLVRARKREGAFENLVADAALAALRAKRPVDFVVVLKSSVRADLPAGPIRREDLARALPFTDKPLVFRLTGKEARTAVDFLLGVNQGIAVAGVAITADDGRKPHAQSVTIDGAELVPEQTYTVALPELVTHEGLPLESRWETCRGETCWEADGDLRQFVEQLFATGAPVAPATVGRVTRTAAE